MLWDVVHSSAVELSSRIAQKNPHMDRRIIILKSQIAASLKQRWTVAEMAKAVNLSNSHLRKIFHDELGISPAKFVREIRLEESRKLLESGILRIKDIASEVGFHNQSIYTRNFKKTYGISPSAYRKSYWVERAAGLP